MSNLRVVEEVKEHGKYKGSKTSRGITPSGIARFPSIHETTRGYQEKEAPHYITDIVLNEEDTIELDTHLNKIIDDYIKEKGIKDAMKVSNLKVKESEEHGDVSFFRFKSEFKPALLNKYAHPLEAGDGAISGGATIKVQFSYHEPYSISSEAFVDGKSKRILKVGVKLYLTGVQLLKESDYVAEGESKGSSLMFEAVEEEEEKAEDSY